MMYPVALVNEQQEGADDHAGPHPADGRGLETASAIFRAVDGAEVGRELLRTWIVEKIVDDGETPYSRSLEEDCGRDKNG